MARKAEWKSGHLDVYVAWPGGLLPVPGMAGDYRRIGSGLAVPARPLTATLETPDELHGIVLEYDLRGDRLACVKITSLEDGPELTWEVLRKLPPVMRAAAADLFEESVVRLIEVDGKPAGELAWQRTTHGGVLFGETADDVKAEAKRQSAPRVGRPPIPDELLDRVAALWLEAERQGVARTAYIAIKFPGYSEETLRNYVRQARKRGKLPPAGTRQPKGKSSR